MAPRRPPDILRKSHVHTEGKTRAGDKRELEREVDELPEGRKKSVRDRRSTPKR